MHICNSRFCFKVFRQRKGVDNCTVGGGIRQAVNMNFKGGRYLESSGTERDLMDIKLDMKFPSGKMAKSLMQVWDAFTDNSSH